MTPIWLLTIVFALLLVRIGWGSRSRLAIAGWIVAAVGLLALTLQNGAWGLAIGSVMGIVSALVMVGFVGWQSPSRLRRPERQKTATAHIDGSSDIGRRLTVFLLVVPCAFAAAQWFAFGLQALVRRGGAAEADAVALTLFVQPTLWGAIMAVQMTRINAWQMIVPPTAVAMIGTVFWGAS